MRDYPWTIAALVFVAICSVGLPVTLRATRGNASAPATERFEQKAGIARMSCERGELGDWTQCTGVLAGRPVAYRCTGEHCAWVGTETTW